MTLSPWFTGQEAAGLPLDPTGAVLRRALGLRLDLRPTLRQRSLGKNFAKYEPLIPALTQASAATAATYKDLVLDGIGPVRPRYYLGAFGIGVILPRPGVLKPASQSPHQGGGPAARLAELHVIPVAVYNPYQYKPLTEAESKGLVARAAQPPPPGTAAKLPPEVYQLAGGPSPAQAEATAFQSPPEGSNNSKKALAIGGVALAAAGIAAAVAFA